MIGTIATTAAQEVRARLEPAGRLGAPRVFALPVRCAALHPYRYDFWAWRRW